jgi:hypothetical protein
MSFEFDYMNEVVVCLNLDDKFELYGLSKSEWSYGLFEFEWQIPAILSIWMTNWSKSEAMVYLNLNDKFELYGLFEW